MYLSKLFIPTSKDLPTEAKIKSHQHVKNRNDKANLPLEYILGFLWVLR